MTLPTSGPLSLSDVLAELQLANAARGEPIALGDADVLALAGLPGPAIGLSDLYGKSSQGAGGAFSVSAPDARAYVLGHATGVTAYSQATASNAVGAVSWNWAYVSGDLMALGGAQTSQASFSHEVLPGESYSAVYSVTGTDSAGHVASAQITVDLS